MIGFSLSSSKHLGLYSTELRYLKRITDGIDSNDMFPGVVLQGSGEEGLREVEARNPEHLGYAVRRPVLHELHSEAQVLHPRRWSGKIELEWGDRLSFLWTFFVVFSMGMRKSTKGTSVLFRTY